MSTWAQIAAARSTNPDLVVRDDLLRERSTLLMLKPQVSANVVGGMGGGVVSGNARESLAISDFNASATGQRITELTNEAIRRGYITPRNDGGFGWGLRDAFLNPAVLAAVGGYFFAPASGASSTSASAADTAVASDAGTLYAPSAAGVDTAAASDAGMLYAPAAASSTPLAPAAGGALKVTAAGSLVETVKDVGQVVGAVAGIAGAASAVRRATSFPANANDLVPTTPAGIVTPADQAVPGQGISSSTLWIIAAVVGVILFRS